MRKGTFSAVAVSLLVAGLTLGAAPGVAQQVEAPHRVVQAATLIGRVVYDDIGQPVGTVRDVVFSRATGESLAVLETTDSESAVAPSYVVAPLMALRLPVDNVLRLVSGVQVAALPPIDMPPLDVRPLDGAPLGVVRGLMVPPPDAGPLQVITPMPQVATDPPHSSSPGPLSR